MAKLRCTWSSWCAKLISAPKMRGAQADSGSGGGKAQHAGEKGCLSMLICGANAVSTLAGNMNEQIEHGSLFGSSPA